MLDGYLARKNNVCTETGAFLDSTADFVFFIAAFFKFIPRIIWSREIILCVSVVFFIRMLSLFVIFVKFKKAALLHTYLNKATGFVLFILPLTIRVTDIDNSIKFVCLIAGISAVEELIIDIKSSKLDRNIKSIINLKYKKNKKTH